MGKPSRSVTAANRKMIGKFELWSDADRRFVTAFCRHHDLRRAYREAGLPEPENGDTLMHTAANYARRVHIAAFLEERREEIKRHLTISEDRVLEELAKIGFFNIGKLVVVQDDGTGYLDLSHMEAHDAAAISEITSDVYMDGTGEDARPVKSLKIKLSPKTHALELIGKSMAMFTDRQEVHHTIDIAARVVDARMKARNARRTIDVSPEKRD